MEQLGEHLLLFAVGLNHKTAPVEVREKLYITDAEMPELLAKYKETLSECVVLSTCNRTEIYGVTHPDRFDPAQYLDVLIKFKNAEALVSKEDFFTLISCAACKQLFEVATSVDSRVVGDTQILGQLKNAYRLAQGESATGKILDQLSQRALKIGKKVYTETPLHKGSVSISAAAVELAVSTFGSLGGSTVMVIGAGPTSRLTVEHLVKKRARKIVIANRTRSNAEQLIEDVKRSYNFESEVVDFDDFKSSLDSVDVVISSTGSEEPILAGRDLECRDRKILLIDIAVPRDIDESVTDCKHVILKNIDDLYDVVGSHHERRATLLPDVKKLVHAEMSDFLLWYYSLPLLPPVTQRKAKPEPEQLAEILRVKDLLNRNVSMLHKLAMQSRGNVREDVVNHVQLIEQLKTMSATGVERISV